MEYVVFIPYEFDPLVSYRHRGSNVTLKGQ